MIPVPAGMRQARTLRPSCQFVLSQSLCLQQKPWALQPLLPNKDTGSVGTGRTWWEPKERIHGGRVSRVLACWPS